MNGRWIGLDLRHLLTFQAIADEGSFKAAARRLGYTPSAVSQQMANLERVVGAQLVAREHGRQAFGLTEAGGILLRHLVAIEAQLGAAMADIEALSNAAATLRVGAYESVGARLLPELIGRVQERFPDARVEIEEALSDLEHLRSLEDGSLDVVFSLLPLPVGPYEARAVLRDPWVLVVQSGSELVGRPSSWFDLERVGKLPLVCFRAPRSIDDALDVFRSAGIEPNIVLRSDYNDAVQEFAAAGRGVALMPRLAVNPRDNRTAIVELEGLIPPRDIALAWHAERDRSELLETFVSLAGELGSRLQGPGALRASAGGDRGKPLRRADAAGSAGGS
jgi:DNA-binding transcriptional LysR family regulator